jgi:hypothetical protein
MTRTPVLAIACSMLLALSVRVAIGDELPVRKPGLWEMKVLKTGSPVPNMTVQHCTDVTTDRSLNDSLLPLTKQACAKQDLQKIPTGYVADAVCTIGGSSLTAHTEIVGDFNSAYTFSMTSHTDKGPGGKPFDTTTSIAAKWLGACKADQKPGDIVMPGGIKTNVKDMEKLKALIPGLK